MKKIKNMIKNMQITEHAKKITIIYNNDYFLLYSAYETLLSIIKPPIFCIFGPYSHRYVANSSHVLKVFWGDMLFLNIL